MEHRDVFRDWTRNEAYAALRGQISHAAHDLKKCVTVADYDDYTHLAMDIEDAGDEGTPEVLARYYDVANKLAQQTKILQDAANALSTAEMVYHAYLDKVNGAKDITVTLPYARGESLTYFSDSGACDPAETMAYRITLPEGMAHLGDADGFVVFAALLCEGYRYCAATPGWFLAAFGGSNYTRVTLYPRRKVLDDAKKNGVPYLKYILVLIGPAMSVIDVQYADPNNKWHDDGITCSPIDVPADFHQNIQESIVEPTPLEFMRMSTEASRYRLYQSQAAIPCNILEATWTTPTAAYTPAPWHGS